MPNPKDSKKYDAVLIPSQYPRNKPSGMRNLALKTEFAADLGSKHVHVTNCGDGMSLLTGAASTVDGYGMNHRYHPDGHAEAGGERFDWIDRGDGVMYGLLRPEPVETSDEKEVRVSKGKDAIAVRHDELTAIPEADRTPEETAELARLARFLPVMFPERGFKAAPRTQPTGPVPAATQVAPASLSTAKVGASGNATA